MDRTAEGRALPHYRPWGLVFSPPMTYGERRQPRTRSQRCRPDRVVVTTLSTTPPTSSAVEWWEAEPDFWVALLDGDAVGSVESWRGHFVTFDRDGVEIRSSSSLLAAEAALSLCRPRRVPPSYVAVVVGMVALSVAGMTLAALSG